MWSKAAPIFHNSTSYFTDFRRNERGTVIFLKAFITYVLLRVLYLWYMADVLFFSEVVEVPRNVIMKIMFLPALLAPFNIDLFFAAAVTFLLVALALRPSYVINVVLFWLVLALLKLKFPIFNGSDYVLVLLAVFSIPIGGLKYQHPVFTGTFNFARLLLQWQVIMIYLVSGWDKLQTESWRTGDVFEYIRNFEVMFNPVFASLIVVKPIPLLVSWTAILFEMLFGILVKVKRTRLWVLCVGVIFHLMIWLMLGLPDFASVMILSYLIFLTDSDYQRLRLIRP